jgi:peptidoglycan hydrolase-like protein with peptidoglycan-binding domain
MSTRISAVLAALALAGLPVVVGSGVATAAPVNRPAGTVQPDDGIPTNCNFTSSQPPLHRGSSGAAVRQAQCYLNDSINPAHRTPLVVDGDYGSKTEATVEFFQRCVGIDDDGEIGPVTWPRLKAAANASTYRC